MDAQEKEDCSTEGTSPANSGPIDQSQMSTVEMDESAPEEVNPSEESVSPPDEEVSPSDEVSPSEEGASPSETDHEPKVERDSEKREEPEGDTDLSSQSVDELLADWREDLEAFQQMEKDEL